MKLTTAAAAAVAVGFTLTACGATIHADSSSQTHTSTSAPKAATKTTTVPTRHVGGTFTVTGSGTDEKITLTKVIDPAAPATSYITPSAGNRWVSAAFTIINVGSQAVQGDADSDATLIGANGQTYQPDFNQVAGCTDFNDGAFQLAPKESASGCVTFTVPTGVQVAKVEWAPDAGFSSAFGEWLVP